MVVSSGPHPWGPSLTPEHPPGSLEFLQVPLWELAFRAFPISPLPLAVTPTPVLPNVHSHTGPGPVLISEQNFPNIPAFLELTSKQGETENKQLITENK